MSGYAFHPEAFADVEEIWEYIAKDNIDAADRVLADIHSAFRSLVASPHSGHRRRDLTNRPGKAGTGRIPVRGPYFNSVAPSVDDRTIYFTREIRQREIRLISSK